jgi:VanZ family protein
MVLRLIGGGAAVVMLAALFIGGAQPQAVGLFPAPWDKLAHVAYFALFALLLARFVGLPIALALVLSLAVGAADEVHQSYLTGRVGGWDDWLADAVGTGLGLAVACFVNARWRPEAHARVMPSAD